MRYYDWTKRDCIPLALRRADEIREWQRAVDWFKTTALWLILSVAAGIALMASMPR